MSNASWAFTGPRQAWEDEAAIVSDGVAVRLSRRTEGCSDEACCSWPAGPVAAFSTGEGNRCRTVLSERRGQQDQPDAQHELGARQPWKQWSSGESTDGREVPTHPYPARQMLDFGFRKPLRGSNSGVHAEISTSPVCLLANLIA